MPKDQISKQLSFLCSTLDDPRRLELHQSEVSDVFRQQGAPEDVIEIAHDLTKLRRADASKMMGAFGLFGQPFMQPIVHTHDYDYPLQPHIPLPEPRIPDRPLGEVIRGRRSGRNFTGGALGLSTLGSLLFGAIGQTEQILAGYDGDSPVTGSLRSIPSAGALHPTRIFTVLWQEGELAKGVYNYDVEGHALEFVRSLDDSELEPLFEAFPIRPLVNIEQASAIFFISSKFWRVRAKYGPRAYRFCLFEVGAACQNLSLTAVAFGLGHVVLGGFYDDEIHDYLQIDGIDHAVIAAVAVGNLALEPEEESRDVQF
jgi:SagB-type dehydrogenase family enzyme